MKKMIEREWPDVKHCSICHESFSEGGFDISHIWNLGIDHAYACSSKCEIESQSLDFPNAWDSERHKDENSDN